MDEPEDLPDANNPSLDERKFREQCRKALRDESLRSRELRLRLLELRVNRKSKWHELLSPLGVAAIAGLVGIGGSIVTSNLTRINERDKNEAASRLEEKRQNAAQQLERQKQEAALVLKLAEQADPKQRASNLLFFSETGALSLTEPYKKYLRGVAGLKEGESVPAPSLTSLVPTPPRSPDAPKSATREQLKEMFGVPGQVKANGACGEPSERMKKLLVREDVGGFQLQAIRPVVSAVRDVLASLRKEDAPLLAALKPLGGLCIREVRGIPGQFSSHAFGIAVDFSVGDNLPTPRSGNTQYGLILLAKLFEKQGFVWVREEGIHFEASADLLQRWKNEGQLQ